MPIHHERNGFFDRIPLCITAEADRVIICKRCQHTLERALLILMVKLETPLRWTSLFRRRETISSPLSIPLLLMERRNVNCISTDTDMTVFLSRRQAVGRNGIQAKLQFISARAFNAWWFAAAMQTTDTSILTAFIFPNPLKGV